MKKKYLLIVVAAVVIVLTCWNGYQSIVRSTNNDTSRIIEAEITVARDQVIAAADKARRGSGDQTSVRVVSDCEVTSRQRFDSLLDQLSKTIAPNELTELESLFYQCGNFFSAQKALATVLLEHEVTTFSRLQELQIKVTHGDSGAKTESELWQKVVDAEVKSADYYSRLTVLQGDIIARLREGKTATSPEVTAILTEVQNARNQMIVLGSSIEGYRAALSNL